MSTVLDQNKRGLLIVFEGVDRAGKSSQVNMLQKYFEKNRNEETKIFRFPGKENLIKI
jgi:thymidylate kinase